MKSILKGCSNYFFMSKYRNLGLFVSLAAMWGVSFMAIKTGLKFFPPVIYAAIRYYIAGLVILVYSYFVTDKWLPSGREEWVMVLISGALMFAGYNAFLYVGELSTTSAVAAVIVSLNPLFTTGFARSLLPSEKLSFLGMIGVGLGFLGIIVISRPDPANLLSEDVLGKFLVFGAALSFALGSVLIRRVDADLPRETMISWAMITGAIMMHLISLGRLESLSSIVWTKDAIIPVFYLSIISGVIGFMIYFDLLERLGPVEINLVSYVSPFFAAVAGWIFLNESVDSFTIIGFLIIFLGFYLIKREQFKDEFTKIKEF